MIEYSRALIDLSAKMTIMEMLGFHLPDMVIYLFILSLNHMGADDLAYF